MRRRRGEKEDGVEFDTRHITLLLRTHHLARKQNLETPGRREEGRKKARFQMIRRESGAADYSKSKM